MAGVAAVAEDHRPGRSGGTVTRDPADRLPARFTRNGALHDFGLGGEQILLAQLVQHVGNQALAGPSELGKASQVVLAVAMPPYAGGDRAQAMSSIAVLIVEEKLLTDRLLKETFLTCSW